MSTLSGINHSSAATQAAATSGTSHAQRQHKIGYAQQDSGGPGAGGLMQSIAQSLSQMGVSMTAPQGSDASSTQNPAVPQAMGQLMHDLMSAVHQQSSSTNSSQSSYGSDFSTRLQNLISQLESSSADSSSSGNSDLSKLTADFNNLLNAVKSQSGTGSQTSGTDSQSLLTFLKNLQANLASSGTPKTGGLVATSS